VYDYLLEINVISPFDKRNFNRSDEIKNL
jgi:hypothetical protein